MSIEAMESYFDRLEAQSKALKEEALRLCWYMRGGLSYEESMMLSLDERKLIGKIAPAPPHSMVTAARHAAHGETIVIDEPMPPTST